MFAHRFARGQQLAAGPLGEPFGSHPAEHVMGEAELLARVHAPTLATQPLAIQKMGAGAMYGDTATGEPVHGFAVQGFGGWAVAEQCA